MDACLEECTSPVGVGVALHGVENNRLAGLPNNGGLIVEQFRRSGISDVDVLQQAADRW